MKQNFGSYDVATQTKPALIKCYQWMKKQDPPWGWSRDLLLELMRQMCIDNVKNQHKAVNDEKKKHQQVTIKGRPPKPRKSNTTDSQVEQSG